MISLQKRYLSAQTCCLTGHRPNKLPWRTDELDPRCLALKRKLYDIADALYCSGIRHFISGMALGCDTYFCEAIIELRDEHPDIVLEAAIPFKGQSDLWSEADKSRYNYLVSQCDFETVLQEEFSKGCMLARDRYMVDNSSVVIAVYNGSKGGTQYTVNYAKKSDREIIILDPDAGNQ